MNEIYEFIRDKIDEIERGNINYNPIACLILLHDTRNIGDCHINLNELNDDHKIDVLKLVIKRLEIDIDMILDLASGFQ